MLKRANTHLDFQPIRFLHYSPADYCMDCAFDDKSMKLGTVVDKVLTKIFFDRDIAILPRG